MSNSELESHVCGQCGILWAAPAFWWKMRREDKAVFYCPNGHERVFRKSRADELAEELSRERQRLAQKDDEIRRQREYREAAERRESAAKGQVTKLRKRASAGVCPCCNRTFHQLADHMAQKHPGFSAESVEAKLAGRKRS